MSDGIPLRGITGCILSNEYLDAMPVHRVRMEDGKLRELYVGVGGGELVEVVGEPSTGLLQERLDGLGVTLAEGQRAEINLGLEDLTRSLRRVSGVGIRAKCRLRPRSLGFVFLVPIAGNADVPLSAHGQ